MTVHPRPFDAEGLAARVAPFTGALLLAFGLLYLHQGRGSAIGVLVAAAVAAAIVFGVGTAPWERFPDWVHSAPPLVFLLVVALLREADGGANSAYTPLALLPPFWLALYGTRLNLLAGLAGVAVTLFAPIFLVGAPSHPPNEWRGALTWTVVAAFVGLTVQQLVFELRDRASRLEIAARRDELTSLSNRRAWDEQLPRELARARRERWPLCVAMLDLDEFKAFNDTHGHQAGDRLLRETAQAWSGRLRVTDLLARYGGEEFGAVFPNCSLDDALILVERLRESVAPGLTVSAGVAEWDFSETAEALVGRADAALYESKHLGRDLVTIAG